MRRTAHPVIELLRTVPGLASLPVTSLAELTRLVDEVTVHAGDVLAREGTVGREAFVVIDGHGTVFVDGEHVADVGPGDFIGEMAMLDRQPRCATVRAETPMRLLVIGPTAFAAFVEHRGVLKSMALQLNQRLRRADTAAAGEARQGARPS